MFIEFFSVLTGHWFSHLGKTVQLQPLLYNCQRVMGQVIAQMDCIDTFEHPRIPRGKVFKK